MQASRFSDGDFDDNRMEQIGAKVMAAATSLKINMHRDKEDGKVMMCYTIEGEFGESEDDDSFANVDSDEAKATARAMMRAFLGK